MKLARLAVWRYDLPLVRPLHLMGRTMATRAGYLIRLTDDFGHQGYGEVAPFPGLHREDLDLAGRQLHQLGRVLPGAEVPADIRRVDGAFEDWLRRLNLAPSVRFGVELAGLNLLAGIEGHPLYDFFSSPAHRTILINGLVTGPVAEAAEQAEQLRAEGYRVVKLKVGRQPLPVDVAAVKAVSRVLGDGVKLRLDANRTWSLSEAVDFGRSLDPDQIEYIEEPVRRPDQVTPFFQQTGIAVALDESLTELTESGLAFPMGVRALILKPSLLGGIEKTAWYARMAALLGLVPVLSSAFDSGVSLSALAQLAAVLTPPDVAMGLDTYKWLKEDLLTEPFRAEQGRVDAEEAFNRSKTIRSDLLRPEDLG
ncbi:MAG: o-succinylbenzoate synthase [Deltaproteobacteria bacterium]|nr:o-succinylbenzoate synthase [Deltaproteobacteria bacterium]